ncbi:hypothetical protein DRO26_01110, partial [Candidatus Bathyarchaeota archaeon]
MKKPVVLVVGLGEVGLPLFELLKESGKFDVYGWDINKEKMQIVEGKNALPDTVDIMHVCYPCQDQSSFVKITVEYMEK